MYYIAKGLEFLGLVVMLIGFVFNFPKLMNPYFFIYGLVLFLTGWVLDKYILK